jgi:hypothetical protein
MANTFAPNGFSQYSGNGSAPTYEQVTAAIASSNTTPIFTNDPVMYSVNSSGVGTGYIQQAYGPVTLTVGATAIVTSANGVLTVTYTGYSTPTSNLPTFASQTWAPPVGSTLVISGATGAGVNGAFTVTASSASAGTVTCAAPNLPVSQTSTASGTVTVYVPVAGIFVGCKYFSVSQKRPIPSPYWLGSDTSSDVEAYIVNDPNARFSVCTGNSNTTATAVGISQVGQNIGFAWNDATASGETNGNTASGLSTMFADQYSLISANSLPASNPYLPFRIVGLQNYVAGQTSPLASINGNDSTTAYNRIIVGFNNAMTRNFAGI